MTDDIEDYKKTMKRVLTNRTMRLAIQKELAENPDLTDVQRKNLVQALDDLIAENIAANPPIHSPAAPFILTMLSHPRRRLLSASFAAISLRIVMVSLAACSGGKAVSAILHTSFVMS
jgi:hypothetical protein